ncbi:tellurite resistance TerB family protein [Thalassococcus sp. CAU 1522]|uniref:Tellurite resistance TerB family protein n=1 Tax=Thalassococcus arenae TaxID=2851652 RepID=A0ABS6NCA0_9RHOB|nr:DUF533 domain-containing protein [Thalassococcus arenae]MBV2361170.1 tellurite resistance TerB family protein [Thalassococcus arenae]
MGLMGTLAKVAIGYAAARGVDKLAGGQGLGGLLGGGAQIKGENPMSAQQAQMGRMMTGEAPAAADNPMADMMKKMQEGGLGALMGGAGGTNPLAGMMEKMQQGGFDLSSIMGGGSKSEGASGGLLSGAGSGAGAGLAGLLAMMGGAAAAQGKGAGAMLDAMNTRDTAPEAEQTAALMLRAMIQAAKADGGIDAAEKAKILETVGEDADADDIAFVNAQLAAPIDVDGLAADTPQAQRMQVYAASLMTIRVDTAAEAQYLDALAKAMGLDETTVNALHMQMGMQPLYN